MDGFLWGLVIVGGPVLLGLAMYLYGNRRRRLSPTQTIAAEQTARENWGKEEIH